MLYSDLVEVYVNLEATSSRLEMASILADLFSTTQVDILARVVYLTQGRVYPQFRGGELGLAEKMVLKAISTGTGIPEDTVTDHWYSSGDMGSTAQEMLEHRVQTALFTEDLTIAKVHSSFERIADTSGSSSQDLKRKLVAELFHSAGPVEGKFIVRTILGRLRLGVGDMTIIDSLASAFEVEKAEVERAYSIHPDLGAIAVGLAEEGASGLERFVVTPGIPLQSMLAERLPSIEDILERLDGPTAFEYKYDGLRVQAHIGDEITLFSRQLEDITPQFPDIVDYLREAEPMPGTIVEGEAVPVHPETGEMLPFQVVSRRRGRKTGLDRAREEVPVQLILFDCIMAGGRDLTMMPYLQRRSELEEAITFSDKVRLAVSVVTEEPAEAESFFEKAISMGCEGIVAKSTAEGSVYRAGSRGFLWIKYKRDYRSELTDTLDLVMVGAYRGRGKRSGRYGALLMAVYNRDDDVFETICKLGTGFDDETLGSMVSMIEEASVDSPGARTISRLEPDVWVEPIYVLEVSGAEITKSPVHTCASGHLEDGSGLAVRFPRFTGRWRDDKAPEDATTASEIVSMYGSQIKQ